MAVKGVFHSCEIPFVFHVLAAAEDSMHLHGPAEVTLSTQMVQLWSSFAASGVPSAPGIAWPRYNASLDQALILDLQVSTASHLHMPQCNFWDKVW
jgi:carboxylesterase type B